MSIAALALALSFVPAGTTATAAETAQVLVEGFSFQPPEVSIVVEESVTWTVGTDPEQHTVTPRDTGAFEDSGQLFTGDTFTVTFDAPGSFEYFCNLHPNMVGTVDVAAVAPTPPESPSAAPSASAGASPAPRAPPPAGEAAPNGTLLLVAAVLGVVALGLLFRVVRRRA